MALILDGTDGITSSGGTNVLQDDAVITANIADGAVSDAKIAAMAAAKLTGDVAAARITTALNATGSAPVFAARAWVNFNGTTSPGTIRASGNVSSVTRNATGDFSVNFTTAMPDADFSAQVLCQRSGGFPYMGWGLHRSSATGTTFVRIETWSEGGYAAENPPIVCVSVSR